MPFQQDNNFTGRTFVADTVNFDQGLRRHMIGVYNNMMLGVVLSGLIAYLAGHSPAMIQMIYGTSLRYIVMLAPLGFVLVLSFGIQRLSLMAARTIFYGFSATMGLSLSYIFGLYRAESIALTFFITASTFAAMSLYGYTTKANLTGMGSFLMMGLFGIIIANVANFFLQSPAVYFISSVLGVLIFTGFTAFDTQKIRNSYSQGYGVESNGKLAVLGALTLYLDFVNLFLLIMRFAGNRR